MKGVRMEHDNERMEHEREMLSDVSMLLQTVREQGTTLPPTVEIYHLERAFTFWLQGLPTVAESFFLTAKTLKERRTNEKENKNAL